MKNAGLQVIGVAEKIVELGRVRPLTTRPRLNADRAERVTPVQHPDGEATTYGIERKVRS